MLPSCFRPVVMRNGKFLSRDFMLLSSELLKMFSKRLFSTVEKEHLNSAIKCKPVTHVIFDMDGLLLDTETVHRRLICEITARYGKKYTSDIQLKVLGTTEQRTAEIIVKECGLPISANEFIEEFKKKQITALVDSELMEGAENLIRHLFRNKVPIAIATGSGKESVKVKIAKHKELFDAFSHIVMGSSDAEVKNGKPAPDIFQICARRFDDKPDFSKCLVFEDAPNGVTGAIAAGMQTVMVPDKNLPKEKTKDATIVLKSLLDFRPEIFGLPGFGP